MIIKSQGIPAFLAELRCYGNRYENSRQAAACGDRDIFTVSGSMFIGSFSCKTSTVCGQSLYALLRLHRHWYRDTCVAYDDAPLVVLRYIGHDTICVSPAQVSRCIDVSLRPYALIMPVERNED